MIVLQKKLQQLEEKVETTPVANKQAAETLVWQAESRQGGDFARHPPLPFPPIRWKEFSREIERAVDEINHLDSEIKKLETAIIPFNSRVYAS